MPANSSAASAARPPSTPSRQPSATRWSPPYADVAHSKLVIIWGHNPFSTAPHFMPFLRQAQHQGCQRRRHRSAEVADGRRAPTGIWRPCPARDGVLALGMAHVLVAEGLHDKAWLDEHTRRLAAIAPTPGGFPTRARGRGDRAYASRTSIELARLYGRTRPGLIKIADGINRNRNGGQNVRAVCALPAPDRQYGVRGGGLAYSTSGCLQWDSAAVHHWEDCPRPGRIVNMNRLGAALLGEAADPPIRSLYVFNANPASSTPNAGRIVEGLQPRGPVHRRSRAVPDRHRPVRRPRAAGHVAARADRPAQGLRPHAADVQSPGDHAAAVNARATGK